MKRKWTDVFVERPVIAWVVNILLIVAGVTALTQLNTRQYPHVESSTVEIRTRFVGADAQKVRGFITTPIERSIASVDGIDYIESNSSQGMSVVRARLRLNHSASVALADFAAKIDKVAAELPQDAESPTLTVEPSDGAVATMYAAFASSAMLPHELTDTLDRLVLPRLSAVDGVQRVELSGEKRLALRIWLDASRMTALGVAPSDIRTALQTNHHLAAVGELRAPVVQINLRASSDLKSAEEFRELVVRREGDTVIRLGDISTVSLGAEDYDASARYSGTESVFLGVWVQPDASNLEVIAAVHAELAEIGRELPALSIETPYDATVFVRHALREVTGTLAETVLIVVLVILCFLGSLRAAVVPLVVIPLSLFGGIFMMYIMGFSINLLTLLAIVLSVGLVVDDAIVVLEKVDRYIRDGMAPKQAAIKAARELVAPIFAMTVTLAAVYAPIGLQGGLTGALFREFAFTLAGTVLISGVVAITLSPMMAAKVLRPQALGGSANRLSAGVFAWVQTQYGRGLELSLQHRRAILVVWAGLSLLVAPMYMFSAQELAPTEDQGGVLVAVDVPPNASLEQIQSHSQQIEQRLAAVDGFDSSWLVGSPQSVFGGLEMRDWSERESRTEALLGDLIMSLGQVPGVRAIPFLPSALPSPGNFPVEFVLVSHLEHGQLLEIARAVSREAGESGQLAYPPTIDLLMDQREAEIELDRLKIAGMGMTLEGVGNDLKVLLSGDYVGHFEYSGRSYRVIPQLGADGQSNLDQLLDLHVRGPAGQLVPLSSVASIKHGVEARSLNRFNQLNAVKLSGYSTQSLDGALSTLEALTRKHAAEASVAFDYAGESRQLRQEQGKFLPAIALAVLLVFLVLAAQFNSFRDPLVVLAGSVPLAMFGALIFTFLYFAGPPGMAFPLTQGWTTSLNIYSQVGLVTLVGLVAKNGILIVEHAGVARTEGASKIDAIREAARSRLRPILMTTAATVVGHFPLVLVSGPGAAARNSIGLILVGGMILGTFFTLFVVPSIYMVLAKAQAR